MEKVLAGAANYGTYLRNATQSILVYGELLDRRVRLEELSKRRELVRSAIQLLQFGQLRDVMRKRVQAGLADLQRS